MPREGLAAALILLVACGGEYRLREYRLRRARDAEQAERVERLRDPSERAEAADWIEARLDALLPALLHAARSDDPELQAPVIDLLGALRVPEAGPLLLDLTSSAALAEVRAASAAALGRLGDPAFAPPLSDALSREKTADVRACLVWALGMLGDPRGFDAVAAAARDPSDPVRLAAYEALSRIPDPRAVKLLIERYRELPRRGAYYPVLVSLVRSTAPAAALAPVDPAGYDLPADFEESCAVLRALGAAATPAALALIETELVASPSARVRRAAAEVLGRGGGRGAVRPLIAALLDLDAGVSDAALGGLERLTGERLEAASEKPWERRYRTFDLWMEWWGRRQAGTRSP